jgi:hypothetical protein
MKLAKFKISLKVPDKEDKYFSFPVKFDLNNEPAQYSQPEKIFVVSDIEGNFNSFFKLLLATKVVDKYLNWIFEENHLVINGDCFDRGEQVTECLWLIYSLEEKAKRVGGYVHFILGNHEVMNMNGDWRYVHPKYAEVTKKKRPHLALYGGNAELWRWLGTKNIIEKIGGILFVHAGISEALLETGATLYKINNAARPYYSRANEIFEDKLLSVIFNSESSPFWYRGYYQNAVTEVQLDAILKYFEVNTIITGHTVIPQVSSFYNGKLINVNTDHAIGNSEGLLIKKDKFYRVTPDGNREQIK